MTAIIMLIVFTISVINGYLVIKIDKNFDLGITMSVVSAILLAIHIAFWVTASYRYNLLVNEKIAFEQTLKSSRSNDQYETATIAKNIAQWNIELARMKYNNKASFLEPYIDDRIELLKPIK